MTSLNIRPTRMVAPPTGRAALELVQFPLFSTVALDNTAVPSQIAFFNYALGQSVSSNLAAPPQATRYHTNMETANFLSAPKTFTVTQIRVVMSQLGYSSNTPTAQATVQPVGTATATQTSSNIFNDTLTIGSMAFRFAVGPKDYVNSPLWAIAGNSGLGGTASVSVATNLQAAAGPPVESGIRSIVASAPMYAGRSWNIKMWPVLIANQQSFSAELLNGFTKTNLVMQGVRLVHCVLEGVLGREVS